MDSVVPRSYLEVRLSVDKLVSELVCDYIIENIANGIVLEEEEDAEETGIIFYVQDDKADYKEPLDRFLTKLVETEGIEKPESRERRIKNVEWLEKYRESVQPIKIEPDIVVRPTWVPASEAAYDLVVEPRMAFGTGSHATTRSCLKVIRAHFKEGMRFLDMGCGSGILSILADKMGAAFIKAVDYDLAAIANCHENLKINTLRLSPEVITGSIEKCQGDEPYDFVCANIIRTTILQMLDRLLKLTTSNGLLVLSGLLEHDVEAITGALAERGQEQFDTMHDEGWVTITVRKN